MRPFPSACDGCGTGILDASIAVSAAIQDGVMVHALDAGRR